MELDEILGTALFLGLMIGLPVAGWLMACYRTKKAITSMDNGHVKPQLKIVN